MKKTIYNKMERDAFAKINNVWLMSGRAPENYLPKRLYRIYLGNTGKDKYEKGVEMKKKFPNLFPSDQFQMSIIQAIYAKLYDLYEKEQNNQKKEIFLKYLTAILDDVKQNWRRENGNELFERISNLVNGEAGFYIDPINEPPEIEDIRREIHQAYIDAGFTYSYFGWINKDNLYIKAKRGELPLNPNTFEAASFFRDNNQQYKDIIKKLENPNSRIYWSKANSLNMVYNLPSCRKGKYLGWKKSTLIDAIKKSGLMKPIPKGSRTGNNGRINGVWSEIPLGILYKDIGVNVKGRVPGLTDSMYGSSCYYDALYRKIFQPHGYIDWSYMCKNKYVDFHTLRHVAVKDFGVKYEDIKKMNYSQLCSEVSKYADQHYKMTQKLAQSLDLDIGTAMAFRPGSPWVKEVLEVKPKFKEQNVKDPFQQYKILKEFCERPDTTKESLVELTVDSGIRYLLPEKLDQYSKGDVCSYLLGVYLPKAEKYEAIAIDCDNKYIGKRQIINTAMIMGLGNILPKDLTNVTKEQLCNIINNYVNVLREAKAPKFAPTK